MARVLCPCFALVGAFGQQVEVDMCCAIANFLQDAEHAEVATKPQRPEIEFEVCVFLVDFKAPQTR